MMTEKTRSLRSDDFGQADEAASRAIDIRDGARRQAALDGPARPFNDNTRSWDSRSKGPRSDHAGKSRADRPASEPAEERGADASLGGPVLNARASRRFLPDGWRGPLVTRWIGFAARRRQAQARADPVDADRD